MSRLQQLNSLKDNLMRGYLIIAEMGFYEEQVEKYQREYDTAKNSTQMYVASQMVCECRNKLVGLAIQYSTLNLDFTHAINSPVQTIAA